MCYISVASEQLDFFTYFCTAFVKRGAANEEWPANWPCPTLGLQPTGDHYHMWVNRPLQVSRLGQLSLSSFRGRLMSSKMQLDARFNGAIWWMLTGWRPGVVDWGGGVLASCCCGSSFSLVRAMDGRISAAAPLTLADQLPLPMIEKRGVCLFRPCKSRYIRIMRQKSAIKTALYLLTAT